MTQGQISSAGRPLGDGCRGRDRPGAVDYLAGKGGEKAEPDWDLRESESEFPGLLFRGSESRQQKLRGRVRFYSEHLESRSSPGRGTAHPVQVILYRVFFSATALPAQTVKSHISYM